MTAFTKVIAALGIAAIVCVLGISAVTAAGDAVPLSEGVLSDHGSGDCQMAKNQTQQKNMTQEQLQDGSCNQNQELLGEGDMAQNMYQWSYQYQNANMNGFDEAMETLGGDQVQNQHEWSWQFKWSHEYGDDEEPLT